MLQQVWYLLNCKHLDWPILFFHFKINWQFICVCSKNLKSKCAIKLGATKDTREIFRLSGLFLCSPGEIQCAIMARTDPSFDIPLLGLSSDLIKRFLHCSYEQFICLYFFQIVLHVSCLPPRQCSIRKCPFKREFGHQDIFCEAVDGGRAAIISTRVRTVLPEYLPEKKHCRNTGNEDNLLRKYIFINVAYY